MPYLYILMLNLCLPFAAMPGRNCADLHIKQFSKPVFDVKTRKTTVSIIVENRGKLPSDTTMLTLTDIEVPEYSDELSRKPSLTMYGEKPDYIRTFADTLLPMAAGEQRTFTFTFDYWVYDPDCELEAIIDPENRLQECRKDNNSYRLLEKGQ